MRAKVETIETEEFHKTELQVRSAGLARTVAAGKPLGRLSPLPDERGARE